MAENISAALFLLEIAPPNNPKGLLNEVVIKIPTLNKLPEYKSTKAGEPGMRVWESVCTIIDDKGLQLMGNGRAQKKRAAEGQAALEVLTKIKLQYIHTISNKQNPLHSHPTTPILRHPKQSPGVVARPTAAQVVANNFPHHELVHSPMNAPSPQDARFYPNKQSNQRNGNLQVAAPPQGVIPAGMQFAYDTPVERSVVQIDVLDEDDEKAVEYKNSSPHNSTSNGVYSNHHEESVSSRNPLRVLLALSDDHDVQHICEKHQTQKLLVDEHFDIIVDLYTSKRGGRKIYILLCEGGAINIALATSVVISKCNIDAVISVGPSVSLTHETKIGDLVLVDNIIQHDNFLSTPSGFELLHPENPELHKPPNERRGFTLPTHDGIFKFFSKHMKMLLHESAIMSGNEYLGTVERRNEISERDPSKTALIADRESYAIHQVCERLNVPLAMLRTVQDEIVNVIPEVRTGDSSEELSDFTITHQPENGQAVISPQQHALNIFELILTLNWSWIHPRQI